MGSICYRSNRNGNCRRRSYRGVLRDLLKNQTMRCLSRVLCIPLTTPGGALQVFDAMSCEAMRDRHDAMGGDLSLIHI